MVTSSRKTDAALEDAMAKTSENLEAIESTNAGLSKIEQVVEENKNQADQEREILGAWAKKMLMILGIVFLVLFVILLVLITNRGSIKRANLKLEAKVDNNKEAIDLKFKEVLKKHEEDLAALKASIAKGKN